jgi:hypothetical protein
MPFSLIFLLVRFLICEYVHQPHSTEKLISSSMCFLITHLAMLFNKYNFPQKKKIKFLFKKLNLNLYAETCKKIIHEISIKGNIVYRRGLGMRFYTGCF